MIVDDDDDDDDDGLNNYNGIKMCVCGQDSSMELPLKLNHRIHSVERVWCGFLHAILLFIMNQVSSTLTSPGNAGRLSLSAGGHAGPMGD